MERFQAKKFPIFVGSKFYYYQSDVRIQPGSLLPLCNAKTPKLPLYILKRHLKKN